MELRNLGGSIRKIVDTVSATLFIIMFSMFIVEVVFRYILNDPISWSIEFIMVCFLVLLFFTAAVGLPISRHISFNIVYAALPPLGRRIFRLIGNIVGAVILVVSIPGVFEISVFEGRESTPILHFPFSVFYFTFFLFIVSFALRLILGTIQLFRPGWRERV
jgi:TRAP-type C4-dicarboxylate transport system permease small subunit